MPQITNVSIMLAYCPYWMNLRQPHILSLLIVPACVGLPSLAPFSVPPGRVPPPLLSDKGPPRAWSRAGAVLRGAKGAIDPPIRPKIE